MINACVRYAWLNFVSLLQLLKVLGEFPSQSAAPNENRREYNGTPHEPGQHSRALHLLNAQPAALATAANGGSSASALKQARQLMAAEVDRLANTSAVMGAWN